MDASEKRDFATPHTPRIGVQAKGALESSYQGRRRRLLVAAEAAADLRGGRLVCQAERQWPAGAVRIQSCTLLLQLQMDRGPLALPSRTRSVRVADRSTDQWRRAAWLTDGLVWSGVAAAGGGTMTSTQGEPRDEEALGPPDIQLTGGIN